jgi:solute carrier family 24 (sodium/potassium/calcium exchanger), member 6
MLRNETAGSNNTLQVQPVLGGRSRAISAPAPPRLQTNLAPRLYRSRSPSPTPPSHQHPAQLPSFSIIGALEFREVVQSLRREASANSSLGMFESPVTPYAGGHYHSPYSTIRRGRRPASIMSQGEDLSNSVPLLDTRTRPTSPVQDTAYYASAPGRLQPNEADDYFSATNNMNASVPSILRTPASPTLSDGQEVLYTPPTGKQRILDVLWQIFHTAFPTLAHFPDSSWMGRIAGIFAAPAVFLLTITLPVVVTRHEESHAKVEKPIITIDNAPLIEFNDEEDAMERVLYAEEEMQEEMRELSYSKWLMAVQCVMGPLFCVVVLYAGLPPLGLLLAIVVGGIVAAVVVLSIGGDGTHTSGKMMRCSMGFLVAIFWIMAVADEVVNVLQVGLVRPMP